MESVEGTSDVLFANLLLNVHDEPRASPLTFTPYNWLKTAKIYNQRLRQVPSDWLIENANVVVVLFSSKGADRDGIIEKFQEIYEQTKYVNLPVEVINVPLDERGADAAESYKNQTNWFTLLFDDPLILVLKYMYGITCVPYIYVLRPTCEIVSNNGLADLEVYGRNAIMSWMSVTPLTNNERNLSKESKYYGGNWKYLGAEIHKKTFTVDDDDDGNLVDTPAETQEVTPNVIPDVTEDIPRNVFQPASKKDSEDRLKNEMKDLHYSC